MTLVNGSHPVPATIPGGQRSGGRPHEKEYDMTVATDAVFEMPEDGDNEGTRLSDQNEKNIADPEQGRSADGVDESNVPHADMDLSDDAQE